MPGLLNILVRDVHPVVFSNCGEVFAKKSNGISIHSSLHNINRGRREIHRYGSNQNRAYRESHKTNRALRLLTRVIFNPVCLGQPT